MTISVREIKGVYRGGGSGNKGVCEFRGTVVKEKRVQLKAEENSRESKTLQEMHDIWLRRVIKGGLEKGLMYEAIDLKGERDEQNLKEGGLRE